MICALKMSVKAIYKLRGGDDKTEFHNAAKLQHVYNKNTFFSKSL